MDHRSKYLARTQGELYRANRAVELVRDDAFVGVREYFESLASNCWNDVRMSENWDDFLRQQSVGDFIEQVVLQLPRLLEEHVERLDAELADMTESEDDE